MEGNITNQVDPQSHLLSLEKVYVNNGIKIATTLYLQQLYASTSDMLLICYFCAYLSSDSDQINLNIIQR